jgi:tetratricopeptide (TPR) repeat protein
MKTMLRLALIAAGVMGALLPARAADVAAEPPSASTALPWVAAEAVVKATEADLAKGGLKSVQAHVPDLEHALAAAGESLRAAKAGDDTIFLLTDGQGETLAALLSATNGPPGRKAVAMPNPYPRASLYLGSYYDEIGKPADALRVLDADLALPPVVPGTTGAHFPLLLIERGAALMSLKNYPDALTNEDKGLALTNLPPPVRAVLLRGRGFALTELGRLDEAEQAYRDSLIAEPNNARAVSELYYISRLRAGAPPTATKMTTHAQPNSP